MTYFKKGLLLSAFIIASQPLFYNGSLSALSTDEELSQHVGIVIPKTVSLGAQGTLGFFDSVIKKTGNKMFSGVPNPDDLKSWEKYAQGKENELQDINNDVVTKLKSNVEFKEIGGVSVLDLKPEGWKESSKVAVYLHGGAFTINSAKTQIYCAAPLASQSGLRTIIVDYKRAPFANHHEIVEQAASVIRGLLKGGHKMEDIAVYGDSAGGNLALAAVLKLRDEGLGVPAALALWSPWLDLTGSGDTYKTLEPQDPILSADTLGKCALAAAALEDHKNPLVSPLFGDFKEGMPPVLIQYGTKEMLASDSTRLSTSLRKAGQKVVLSPYEGMWHVFQTFGWELPEGQEALKETAEFLLQNLGR